jgi:hypothetical protein
MKARGSDNKDKGVRVVSGEEKSVGVVPKVMRRESGDDEKGVVMNKGIKYRNRVKWAP